MSTIKWTKYKYTELELREAVKNSRSARAAMLAVGISAQGGGYKPFMRLVKLLQLDTSHWLGQAYLRGQSHKYNPQKPLTELLTENSATQSYKLKIRLIKSGLIKDECARCNITHWCNEKLSLHLDHINGINNDNRLENLRLLCPNCHSLTDTYCGKNKRKMKT